jgi:CubicO group peptidase (beta-lactamase class C family)
MRVWARLIVAAVFGLCVATAGLSAQDAHSTVAGFPSARPEAVGISSERLGRIGEALEREIAQDRMPGAIVAIARRGHLVYFETFGYLDKTAGKPMRADAIFSIASMTKPIFSVAAMSLFEEGRLLMNEPVGSYLPELAHRQVATNADGSRTQSADRQPTIQDLMRHTSGFVTRSQGNTALHSRYPDALVAEPLSAEDYLTRLSELPLRYAPGTTWEYGPGFDILGLAMERVTGQPIRDVLAERVFTPLGMRDTSFTIPADKVARQAKVLSRDPITAAPQTTRNQTEPLPFDCGGGCLASTAADYLTFAQMLLNGGSFGSTRVLGPKTVEYMTSDATGPDIDLSRLDLMASMPAYGYGYGLGVAVRRGDGLGGTTGSAGSYMWAGSQGTYFWVDPREELVVVHMAQTPGVNRGYYRQLLPALVYQAIVD